MGSERVNPDTVAKAVDSLLKWRKSHSETQKAKLFDQDEEFVYLILTLKKIPPKSRVNPHKIPLPHSLVSPFSEHCLIIDDRAKARVTKAQAQSKIQSESIPVAKILRFSKLASDYRPFEAKRKLCNSYDLFFADKRVIPLLPRLLGKQFFKKRKLPVPIDLKKSNWKEQVEKACSSAMLYLRTGTCSVVRVAKVSMERDEIVANLNAAINGIVDVVPKKWANVRSFHVKLLESLALPIYQAVPDVKLKIDARVNAVPEVSESKGELSDKKVGGKKKGRIHEVRYMDDKVSEDESGSDDHDGGDNDVDDDDHADSDDEKVVKKRKKAATSELSGVKRLKKSAEESAKSKKKTTKEGLVGKIESKLSVGDEESVMKKKKKKMDAKVKAKKSKKAA